MHKAAIGEISLTISFVVYLIWYVPQLFHNSKKENIHELSWLMHSILFIAYCADLVYGFGRHMEWQYRTVTVVGIILLLIQQIQIGFVDNKTTSEWKQYTLMSIVLGSVFIFSVISLFYFSLTKTEYDTAGLLSTAGWLIYSIPQMFTNWKLKSANGLSIITIYLGIFLHCCDWTSAYCLSWDFPSIFGAVAGCFMKFILIVQYFKYRRRTEVLSLNLL